MVLAPLIVESDERTFGPCFKCSSVDVGVRFHEGKRHCHECRDIESCRYSSICGRDGRKGEHLTVRCQRCGFAWLEDVS